MCREPPPRRRKRPPRGLRMAIPDDRGDESFADDLNMWPGIVSGRVALLLRSTEIQPAAAPICPLSFRGRGSLGPVSRFRRRPFSVPSPGGATFAARRLVCRGPRPFRDRLVSSLPCGAALPSLRRVLPAPLRGGGWCSPCSARVAPRLDVPSRDGGRREATGPALAMADGRSPSLRGSSCVVIAWCGHTSATTPDPIRTPQLSALGPE